MARTFNGTLVQASMTPYGYSISSVSDIDRIDYNKTLQLEISESSVTNSDPKVEFGNILTSIATSIESTLDSDFDVTSNDVTAIATLNNIRTNVEMGDSMFTSDIDTYIVDLLVNIKVESV